MKDQQFYTCDYCFKEFEPKRRRVQKYCSNTCRSKAYHARKTTTQLSKESNDIVVPDLSNIPQPKMSMAGVGNATAGTLAAQGLKHIFTAPQNRPATKGDLDKLFEKLNGRYHLIQNMEPNHLGQYPYYDMVDGVLVYYKPLL